MPTAAECRAQAIEMVASCETVDSLHRDIQALGTFGMVSGPFARAAHDAVWDEEETLRALAVVCNQLSEELFRREQLCLQYNEDMATYRQKTAEWDSDHDLWLKHPMVYTNPGPAPQVPPPPFPGAQEG